MKTTQTKSVAASALQIALIIALVSGSAVIFAATFRGATLRRSKAVDRHVAPARFASLPVPPNGGIPSYTLALSSAPSVPGDTDVGNHCDNCSSPITPPFPISLYDQTFTTAEVGCGLLIGSGLTCGFSINTWSAQLASNTVQYTFAVSQPAANEFALFETHDPWDSTFIKDAITSNGHTYTEFTPADLATVNFSDYRVVILNWDDTFLNEFITPYTAAIPALEDYAGGGGVVWVQAAIQGNPGDNFPMPFGGQGLGAHLSDSDNVVDLASPMMINIPNPMEGDSASHVSYSGLPGPVHTVVINPNDNQPVLYEFGGTCGGTPTPTPTSTATPSPTPTPTPCTGRCTPTPRPRPTPAPRP